MSMKGVYYIKHVESGRIYIGSSKDVTGRLNEHKRLLNTQDRSTRQHSNRYLRNCWDKYGESSFEFGVLEQLSDSATTDDLREAEQRHIDSKPFDELFNLTKNAKSPLDDDDVRERCRLVTKEYFSDPDNLQKHSEKLKALWLDEEYREKTMTGLRLTYQRPERNKAISDGIKNNHNRMKELSEAAKTLWKDADFREKITKASVEASSKPVVCLNTGETFSSAAEAARKSNLKDHAITCAIYRKGSCGGLFWDYVNDPVGIEVKEVAPTIKRVVRLDTGEVFPSALSASKSLGLSKSAVATSIVRGTKCCGTRWDFVDYPLGRSNDTPKGNKCKKVSRLDTNEVFPSAKDASLAFSKNQHAVAGAIHSNVKFDGSYWEYVKKENT